jgi:hypothetical protein
MAALTVLNGDAGHGCQGWGMHHKTALRATLPTAPTAESVLKVLRPRGARPDNPATTVAPETTMTMAWQIHARQVTQGHRWSLVVIALGSPHDTPSLRPPERDVPAGWPADNVSPAPVFDNVGTRWQSSQTRPVASRISFTDPQSTAICPTIFTPEPGPGLSLVADAAAADSTIVASAAAPTATTASHPSSQQSTPLTASEPSQ